MVVVSKTQKARSLIYFISARRYIENRIQRTKKQKTLKGKTMTKKQMFDAAKKEYFTCMNMWRWHEDEGEREQADRWHNDGIQTERLIHLMFGQSVDVFSEWLEQL